MRRPRLDMMNLKTTATLPTIPTAPVVALKNCRTKRLVQRIAVVRLACWPVTASPVGMRRAAKLSMCRTLARTPGRDGGAVFIRQLPAAQRFRDTGSCFRSGFRRLELSLPATDSRLLCKLGAHIVALSGILAQVEPRCAAGAGAEPRRSAAIDVSTLLTGLLVNHGGMIAEGKQ